VPNVKKKKAKLNKDSALKSRKPINVPKKAFKFDEEGDEMFKLEKVPEP
jgi:hypothetical protein